MSEDPYKLFKSQASGYDVPPQTSSPTYDQSAFNQSNELYQPFESSEDFQNPVGFMGSAPLAQLNPALGGCSAAYGGYGNGNNNPGANYGHPGLTDTTLQPTRNMQDYSAGLTHAPVPAGEFAFADPSQNFMQYTGRGAAGLGSGTASQAPFDYDWSDYTAPNAEYFPPPQPSATKPRFYCKFPGCTTSCGRKPELDRHVMSLHHNPRNFPCPNCNRVFNRNDNLTAHLSSVHGSNGRQPPR